MWFRISLMLNMVVLAKGGEPIIDLKVECPSDATGSPILNLVSDVPTYGVAKCSNGDKEFQSVNRAILRLSGTLDPLHKGDSCIFHHFKGNNSYMLDVEVGLGEDGPVLPKSRLHTVTCSYDVSGQGMKSLQSLSQWFSTPVKNQKLLAKSLATANIRMNILDENNIDVTWSEVPVGRRIRLRAYDSPGSGMTFRPTNCMAQNADNSYTILTAGCGDGLILDRAVGFSTDGLNVYSPYFDIFHLPGALNVQFVCNFTICEGTCDGDSCVANRRKRSILTEEENENTIIKGKERIIVVKSNVIKTKYVDRKNGEERKMSKLQLDDTDVSDYLNHLGSLHRDYPAMKPTATQTSATKVSINELAGTEFLKVTAIFTATGVLIVFLFTAFICYSLEFERYKTKTKIILRSN